MVNLSEASVTEYVRSNVALIEAMIKAGYESRETLTRRKEKMQKWLENPKLLNDCILAGFISSKYSFKA